MASVSATRDLAEIGGRIARIHAQQADGGFHGRNIARVLAQAAANLTRGKQTTLRNSRVATVISGRIPVTSLGSKDMESRSRRETSARRISDGNPRSEASSGL